MIKKFVILMLFLISNNVLMNKVALAGETIVAQEVESYAYQNGKIGTRYKGQFEVTYYIEGDTITRTRVYDLIKKEVIPDNTIYRIQRQLISDPTNTGSIIFPYRVIRAIGQPGSDAVEIIMINDAHIQSVKSTNDYFIVSTYKRIK